MTTFGLIVNPKTGELFQAKKSSSGSVTIEHLDSEYAGEGYFEERDYGSYAQAEHVTGLPRAHTAEGVSDQGTGSGTALYTALCLAADMTKRRLLRLTMIGRGNGISSNGQRSPSADRWWKNARERYGLAVEVVGCARKQVEDTVSGADDALDVVRAIKKRFGVFKTKQTKKKDAVLLKSWSLSVTGEKTVCDVKADAYPIANAHRDGLVVCEIPNSGYSDFLRAEYSSIYVLSLPSLVASNVGILKGMGGRGVDAMDSLVTLATRGGAPKEDIASMRRRFEAGADAGEVSWREARAARPARANPSVARGRRRVFGVDMDIAVIRRGPKKMVAPSKAAKRFYMRGTRQNPVDSGRLQADLDRVQAIRSRLGWGAYADARGAK